MAKSTTARKKSTAKTAVKKSPTKTVSKTASAKKIVTRKVAPKKNVQKTTKTVEKINMQPSAKLPTFTEVFNKRTMIIFAAVLLIGLAYTFRGVLFAATVNGQPITRLKIMSEAEKSQGATILETLIMDSLIEQSAREKGVTVSDEEVNAQIEEYKQEMADSGQDFDQILEMQGLSMKELQRLVRQQKVVEVLVGAEIEVTDEQIDEYLEENKDFLPEDMEEAELREMVEQQLKNQLLSEQYQQWSTDLKNDAKINYFGKYVQEEESLSLEQ